jgi:hypothetical protein
MFLFPNFLLNAVLTLPFGGFQALVLFIFQSSDKQEGVYDLLWAVVFGFATLNIVGLALRKFETTGSRLNLGEILAIMVVGISVILLGWELLYVFKILPFKLEPR